MLLRFLSLVIVVVIVACGVLLAHSLRQPEVADGSGPAPSALVAEPAAAIEPVAQKPLPVYDVNIGEVCARTLERFRPGPIYFEESGTAFRASAHGPLDRVVALAGNCRDAVIAITGHSDSSGDEVYNRKLSLARAQTVAEFLAGRGIAADRLIIAGAGSASPVADNATRYGRSLNRRIEIRLEPGDPTE